MWSRIPIPAGLFPSNIRIQDTISRKCIEAIFYSPVPFDKSHGVLFGGSTGRWSVAEDTARVVRTTNLSEIRKNMEERV